MSITLCLADVQRQRNESMNIDIVFDICNLALLQIGKLFPSECAKHPECKDMPFSQEKAIIYSF